MIESMLKRLSKNLVALPENTRLIMVGGLALTLVLLVETKPWQPPITAHPQLSASTIERQVPAPPAPLMDASSEALMQAETSRSIREIDPQLETLLATGQFAMLKDRLLNLAADAVKHNRSEQMIEIFSLLADVSIEQQNIDSAEVYLYEALDLADVTNNQQARGEIFMQLGRANLKSREIARSAGYAYDALQIGRNQLLRGQYQLAQQNIQGAIDHSLSINRFNSAASAYSSLAMLYRQTGDFFQAEQASLEAARLYSSSGQLGPAQLQLGRLREAGVEEWRLFDVENEIDANYRTYEESINQLAIARDYQRLYHYYLNEGDLARAWHFRLLASKSLQNISKRAMFHRQQGELEILYNSNDSMARAQRYLSDASETFKTRGMDEQDQQARELIGSIY
jgi:tetratricopeptide (TPR) repeat protein